MKRLFQLALVALLVLPVGELQIFVDSETGSWVADFIPAQVENFGITVYGEEGTVSECYRDTTWITNVQFANFKNLVSRSHATVFGSKLKWVECEPY